MKKPNLDFLKPFTSRKFLFALVAAVVAFGNGFWDWGLTQAEVWSVVAPLMTFVGVEGLADIKGRK